MQIQTQTDRAINELEKIVKLFSSHELAGTCAKAFIQSLDKPCAHWSLGNQFLMLISGTDDARGFNQWKSVNRYVKQGTRAIYILAPLIIKKKEVKDGIEEERTILIGFKTIPVFRYEDTAGQPLPEYKPKEIPPLTQVAEKWQVKIKYAVEAGAYGSFDPKGNTITLGVEDFSVFFHELAHKAHSMIEELKTEQNPEQETIAQLTACTLARLYGKNADTDSYQYIAHYAQDHTPKAVGMMCMRVLNKVQKILTLILENDKNE